MKKLIALALLFSPATLFAVSVAWDANPASQNVTKYNIYEINSSGSRLKIGESTGTTYVLPNSTSTRTIAVTAVNATGESTISNTVVVAAPVVAPQPPTNLRVTDPAPVPAAQGQMSYPAPTQKVYKPF